MGDEERVAGLDQNCVSDRESPRVFSSSPTVSERAPASRPLLPAAHSIQVAPSEKNSMDDMSAIEDNGTEEEGSPKSAQRMVTVTTHETDGDQTPAPEIETGLSEGVDFIREESIPGLQGEETRLLTPEIGIERTPSLPSDPRTPWVGLNEMSSHSQLRMRGSVSQEGRAPSLILRVFEEMISTVMTMTTTP
eukprot:3480919-Rhodomonas_salina.1